MTSVIFLGLLVLYVFATIIVRRKKASQRVPWKLLIFTIVVMALWFYQAADILVPYFQPYIKSISDTLASFLPNAAPAATTARGAVKEVFRPPDSPLIEQLISYASVGLMMLCIPAGLWFSWKRYRRNAMALLLGIGAVGYVGTIAIRLVAPIGAELAGRTWPYIFVLAAFAAAVAMVYLWKTFKFRWILRFAGPVVATVLFLASITGGWPPYWGRLPGPFLVGGSERSVEPEGDTAAPWVLAHLGARNRIVADQTNYMLLGAYGDQFSVYGLAEIYTLPELTDQALNHLCWSEIHYVLVDLRMGKGLPARGYYFNYRETNAHNYSEPIPMESLLKYNSMPNVNRLFDSGNLLIYDVQDLCNQP